MRCSRFSTAIPKPLCFFVLILAWGGPTGGRRVCAEFTLFNIICFNRECPCLARKTRVLISVIGRKVRTFEGKIATARHNRRIT